MSIFLMLSIIVMPPMISLTRHVVTLSSVMVSVARVLLQVKEHQAELNSTKETLQNTKNRLLETRLRSEVSLLESCFGDDTDGRYALDVRGAD